ncbi:P27 family phage terminase small subunit [Flagellimonas sp.]|uniref:P27 family phage terminase small subunit n=1 Tax=Flagellimonas sp. TaxID=2058762 RepID=UPI003F4A785D
MKVVGINSGTDKLSELPNPKSFLDSVSKRYYKELGKILIKEKLLKETHLVTLNMLATNCAQWEFAVKAIQKKNKEKSGSGYIQEYTSGATNISTELVLKRDAEKAMRDNISAFGMDPQSERKLKKVFVDPGQKSLFQEFLDKKKS